MPVSLPDRPSRMDLALALLAAGSGAADVFAFVRLGHVFTSAMTGNTALFALALAQGHVAAAARSVVAFGGFVAGAGIGAMLGARRTAFWQLGVGLRPVTFASAAGMGLQSLLARRVDAPGITTTYFTGTLASIVHAIVGAPPGARFAYATKRQLAVFTAYVLGAVAGGLGAGPVPGVAAALPALAAIMAALVAGARAAAQRP
jgi:uncharacterized membrane protein YoaK (UPF0700 family)